MSRVGDFFRSLSPIRDPDSRNQDVPILKMPERFDVGEPNRIEPGPLQPGRQPGRPQDLLFRSEGTQRGRRLQHDRPPLERRRNEARGQQPQWAMGAGAVGDLHVFPRRVECRHCQTGLDPREEAYGTELCNSCYDKSNKNCQICNRWLPLKALHWNSGLCYGCYGKAEKSCKLCHSSLEDFQLRWKTGVCDRCYDGVSKSCHFCQAPLTRDQRRWGTGMCDTCYDTCEKTCKSCSAYIPAGALRHGTGLCDQCYDKCEKRCHGCQERIPAGSLRWFSGVCDKCYDVKKANGSPICRSCRKNIPDEDTHWNTSLCNKCYDDIPFKICKFDNCGKQIASSQLHWRTGLCDACFDRSQKTCVTCKAGIDFGSLHWGSQLCDSCYDRCDKTCVICRGPVLLGELRWGTSLCDNCYNGCKTNPCKLCKKQIDMKELFWNTGCCNSCYDNQTSAEQNLYVGVGVKLMIWAQFVFYFASGILRPAIFLELRYSGYGDDSSRIYAATLSVASLAAMVAPVPFGLWAQRRGEREVYFGVSGCAALAAVSYGVLPMTAVNCIINWAILNLPPAVRGVRAAYFAKHVPPRQLNRASQLASSSGLAGGFLGPLGAALAQSALGRGEGSVVRPSAFEASSILSAVMLVVVTVLSLRFVSQAAKKGAVSDR
ncbi:unnamed protein product, partial [Prorocentrum cordatum]